jgi:sterol desaturase/sphingolipid hydroxylase (fatty acid hydroxylase superfamily)
MIPLLLALALFSAVMIPVETTWPGVALQRRFRRGWSLDVVYWFFTTLITKPISRIAVAVTLSPLLLFTGAGSFENLLQGFGPLGRQPRLDQAVQMIILIDFTGYWLHRAFHSRRLWPFHAIHHSSVDLDWLSAARVHPVNDIVNKAIQAAIVVTLGYSPLLLAGALPFFTFYAIFQHANVSWDFGPLRKVFASPRFHRRHHTSAEEGQDKNFASLLPLWDILFGTYYMAKKQPTEVGVPDAVPDGLLGQLVWPFREKSVIAEESICRCFHAEVSVVKESMGNTRRGKFQEA